LFNYAKHFGIAARASRLFMRRQMRQHALSGPQIGILLYLGEHDGAVQEDLVRDIFLDKGTIGRHLQNLERRGYVRREVARDDKRYQHVFLTPSSEALQPQLEALRQRWNKQVTHNLSANEKAQLEHLLHKIHPNFISENSLRSEE
jgi:DNA-binding MarR family transcriptional regulator